MKIAGASLAADSTANHAGANAVPRLRDLAGNAGLLYGSDSDFQVTAAPPAYAELLIQNCSIFAPNLPWSYLAPKAEAADLIEPDANIAFALAHGMRLTGGHLLWHERIPSWFEGLATTQSAERAITRHATALCGRYAGQAYSWNVVNEAIAPGDDRTDGLRASQLLRKLGPDFFEPAFHAARQADPIALLVYNDYGMEMDSSADEARRRSLLALIDHLLSKSVPIDGIGLQSHLRLDGRRFDQSVYRSFLGEIASRDLKILLTELDVLDLLPRRDVAARDTAIADMYRQFLDAALDETAVKAIVSWGLSDRYTWLTEQDGPHAVRSATGPGRPLPFDDNFQPKPAFFAIVDALKAAPRRSQA